MDVRLDVRWICVRCAFDVRWMCLWMCVGFALDLRKMRVCRYNLVAPVTSLTAQPTNIARYGRRPRDVVSTLIHTQAHRPSDSVRSRVRYA